MCVCVRVLKQELRCWDFHGVCVCVFELPKFELLKSNHSNFGSAQTLAPLCQSLHQILRSPYIGKRRLERYPYIGGWSIHQNATHTSEVHTTEHANHTSEDSPYIGSLMYGPCSDVWTCFYAPHILFIVL